MDFYLVWGICRGQLTLRFRNEKPDENPHGKTETGEYNIGSGRKEVLASCIVLELHERVKWIVYDGRTRNQHFQLWPSYSVQPGKRRS